MLSQALHKKSFAGLKIVRIGPGKYTFGSKKIIVKIINNKLVVRVGGGYTSVEDFIDQYGKMELMKVMAWEETKSMTEEKPKHAFG